jgi:hypothetical protein
VEISPYEGVVDVKIGEDGVVTLRTSIPGVVREKA